jgi:hypothetical protein
MRKNFRQCVEFALTMELLLVAVGETVPGAEQYLPVGGSHLKQVGALVLIAIAWHGIRKFFSGSRAKRLSFPRSEGDCNDFTRTKFRRAGIGACDMPGGGPIIFRDLVGKLDVVHVECAKCGRSDRYHLSHLIERYGIDAKLFDWSDEITADCPHRIANKLDDLCGVRCSDLPKGTLGKS